MSTLIGDKLCALLLLDRRFWRRIFHVNVFIVKALYAY